MFICNRYNLYRIIYKKYTIMAWRCGGSNNDELVNNLKSL